MIATCIVSVFVASLVANPAYDAAAFRPVEVGGRAYWTLLNSGVYADPGMPQTEADRATGLAALPLFRDSALVYPFYGVAPTNPACATWRTLPENVGGTNVPMWRALERNLKADKPVFVRFRAKRTWEAQTGEIDLDFAEYRDWAARHPNFLGFVAHDEWRNDVYNLGRKVARLADDARARRVREMLFDPFPRTRQGLMDLTRAYYDRMNALYYGAAGAPTVALRSCFAVDHVAAAWGSKAIGLETTNSTGAGDGEFRWDEAGFFIRGAARQFDVPWCWFLAIYMNGYDRAGKWVTDSVCMNPPYRPERLHGGVSPSLFVRAAYYAYLNGANFIEPEHWYQHLLTTNAAGARVLSERGELFARFHDFTAAHPDRGTPYAPVAILTPFDLGRNPWGGFNWRDAGLGYRPGDQMVDGVFFTLIPGFDRSGGIRAFGEYNLHNGGYAMMHDVLVPDSPQDPEAFLGRLKCYPVAILAGEYRDVTSFWPTLERYVRGGGTLLVPRANVPAAVRESLDARTATTVADESGHPLAKLHALGCGHLIVSDSEWMTPPVGDARTAVREIQSGKRSFPELAYFLRRFQAELFPFTVRGSCRYGVNRTEKGWWLWALNNDGVKKPADAPQVVDAGQAHAIEVEIGAAAGAIREVRELVSGRAVEIRNGRFRWTVPAGGVAVFECAEDRTSVHETRDPRVRTYVRSARLLWQSGPEKGSGARHEVRNAEALLASKRGQTPESGWGRDLGEGQCVLVNGGDPAGVLLDFGRELHGGVQLCFGRGPSRGMKVRIRFGESAAEAMSDIGSKGATNDHAIRDDVVTAPVFGTRELGNTGFRFVRIDLVSPGQVTLDAVRAVSLMRPMERRGAFRCSDERLNRIWETAVRTVHLCCQDYLWDGIKRDRLIWMGDTHPETMAILSVFGADPVLSDSLDCMASMTDPGEWMNMMPTYTLWWIRNLAEWHRYTGDHDYLRKHAEYLCKTFDHVLTGFDATGRWTAGNFLDWPTRHNDRAATAGTQGLALLTMRETEYLANELGDASLAEKARAAAERLAAQRPDPNGEKSAAALLALSGLRDPKEMFADVLGRDGLVNLSTFFGYYMLEAMAEAGEVRHGLDTVRGYWGAMLDVGATSFWEDFKVAWTNGCGRIDELPAVGRKDIHGDYGEFCYRGFRHSLCHGWSCGPAPWLIRHVLGIRPLGTGCRMVEVRPDLGDLEWAEGAMALPRGGAVRVRVEKAADGTLRTTVFAPADVKVVGIPRQ